MTDLSTRAEQAKPEEARGLLELLMLSIPDTMRWGEPRRKLWNARLDCEAYLDASMMLVPEGWETVIYLGGENTNVQMETEAMRQQVNFYPIDATAATPALALISAIARATGEQP